MAVAIIYQYRSNEPIFLILTHPPNGQTIPVKAGQYKLCNRKVLSGVPVVEVKVSSVCSVWFQIVHLGTFVVLGG